MSHETQQTIVFALTVIALAFCIKDCVLKQESLKKIPNAPVIGKILEDK